MKQNNNAPGSPVPELVSVVIPTYKRSQYLTRALDSVLAQTHSNIEIIVVDDNGAGTPDQMATEKLLKLSEKYRQINYKAQPTNRGGCAARNLGYTVAKGNYVAFLDDDDLWYPGFIDKHLAVFSQSDAALVYCNYYLSEAGNTKKMESINHRGDVYTWFIQGWCPASTSLFMLDKAALGTEPKPFDETLVSFQDYDCWLNYSRRFIFDFSEEYLVVKYNDGQEQLSRNPEKRRNALQQLKLKWNKLLEGEDLQHFQATVTKFEKNQLYHEFLFAARNQSVGSKLSAALKYLRFGQSSLIDCARVIRYLVVAK